jgi:hypothetical protein
MQSCLLVQHVLHVIHDTTLALQEIRIRTSMQFQVAKSSNDAKSKERLQRDQCRDGL